MTLTVDALEVVGASGRRLVGPVSFTAARGLVHVVVGENGAGKSSLLNALAGVVAARGRAALEDRDLASVGGPERARLVASLAQHSVSAPALSVRARIGQGFVPRDGPRALLTAPRLAAIDGVADALSLTPLLDRPLGRLSGGERRRVEVARALVDPAPPLVLLDEPYAGVDLVQRGHVTRAMRARARAGTIVVVTVHELDTALALADRVIGLRNGALVHDGPTLDDDAVTAIYGVRARVLTHDGAHAVALVDDEVSAR